MSRLALVPPHLIDMPSIGMARTVPSQTVQPDPFSLSIDLPVANADFSNWTGQNDGLEQEHEGATAWDFTNDFGDDEFWGVGIPNTTTIRIVRKGINAAGQLAQIAAYTIDPRGASAVNSGYPIEAMRTGTQYFNAMRLGPATLVLFAQYTYQGLTIPALFIFKLDNGNFSLSSVIVATDYISSSGTDTYPINQPTLTRIYDNQVAVAGLIMTADAASNFSLAMFNVAKGTYRIGTYTAYASTVVYPNSWSHRLSPTRTVFCFNSQNSSIATSFVPIDFVSLDTDAAISAPVSQARFTAGQDTIGSGDENKIWTQAFLSASRLVMYVQSTKNLALYNFSGSTANLLSTLSMSSTLLNATTIQSIVRVNATEFLITYPDPTDGSRNRSRTQRVFINADNSMTLGNVVTSYAVGPYKPGTGGSIVSQYYPTNRGTTLSGNRILLQNRRSETYLGRIYTKLLRGGS